MKPLVGIAFAILWLLGLGAYPLLESTEGRYASIASAMSRTGEYLDPRFDGLLHFDKPPLAYWAGALALRVLPDDERTIRLPASLAWGLAVILVFLLARALGFDRRSSGWASAFAGLAPLAVAQGRMLSSDIFLWVGVLLFQLGWARGGRPVLCGLGLALGFLAKGPVVLMWTLLPALIAIPFLGRSRALAGLSAPGTWGLFALLGLPWYVLMALLHPGLVEFWLGHETAARYLSSVHGRVEPWWYFPALLPLVVLPWLPEAIRGVARNMGRSAPGADSSSKRMLLLMAFVPFLFLCFSSSKRPNYLLPMLGPLALLAAAALPPRRSPTARVWIVAWTVFVLAVPFVMDRIPRLVPPTRSLAAAARHSGGTLVAFRTLPSSLPFYRKAPVPTVGIKRGSSFDTPETLRRWSPVEDAALVALLADGGMVLARTGDEGAVREVLGGHPGLVMSDRGFVLLQVDASEPR